MICAISCCLAAHCGYPTVMGVSTVLVALAGLVAILAAVAVGVSMVLGSRNHDSRMSDRVRRFFNDRRREGRGL